MPWARNGTPLPLEKNGFGTIPLVSGTYRDMVCNPEAVTADWPAGRLLLTDKLRKDPRDLGSGIKPLVFER